MRHDFEDYVRARGDALRRFAYLLCGDRQLGEDLVQEVLIKAYRRWSRIEADDPADRRRAALRDVDRAGACGPGARPAAH